jgi:hypothetical protein
MIMVLLCCVVCVGQVTGKAPLKPEYESDELKDTAEALALIILRVSESRPAPCSTALIIYV